MFKVSWLGIMFLAIVVFFVAIRWQQKRDEYFAKEDEKRRIEHNSLSRLDLVKEAGLVAALVICGLLFFGIIRPDGVGQGCSYNRYEGPDACYDQY